MSNAIDKVTAAVAGADMSPEARALVQAFDAAEQTKAASRQERRDAQAAHVMKQRKVAGALREMAANTRRSGWYQFAMGMASAAAQGVGAYASGAGATAKGSLKADLHVVERAMGATSRALDAVAKVDAFQWDNADLRVAKQEFSVESEVARGRSERATDAARQAQQTASDLVKRFSELHAAKHAARMAALRG